MKNNIRHIRKLTFLIITFIAFFISSCTDYDEIGSDLVDGYGLVCEQTGIRTRDDAKRLSRDKKLAMAQLFSGMQSMHTRERLKIDDLNGLSDAKRERLCKARDKAIEQSAYQGAIDYFIHGDWVSQM